METILLFGRDSKDPIHRLFVANIEGTSKDKQGDIVIRTTSGKEYQCYTYKYAILEEKVEYGI